ncbi:MAG: zonular occludens toxin domain-containing protein, partial [Candidatus Pacearchaeota archaeon]
PVTKGFALKVSEITAEDWVITFGLNFIDPVAIVLERNVNLLAEELKEGLIRDFDIDDIIKAIAKDQHAGKAEKDAAINLLQGAKTWGVFATKKEEGTAIEELIKEATTTILDLSCYSSIGTFNVRALIIGLICKKIFSKRLEARRHEEIEAVRHGLDYLAYKEKREMPLVWIFIDEAHEFLPQDSKTAATDALIQLLREGRQPGISLVLATQQPGQIHRDVMTQADIVISHLVTAKPDVDALNYIMQSYLAADIKTYLDNLPHLKGSAIILDDNSERIYPMRVRPRFTWHGGEAPTAIKVKKRL